MISRDVVLEAVTCRPGMGHGSRVTGHGSRATGHGPRILHRCGVASSVLMAFLPNRSSAEPVRALAQCTRRNTRLLTSALAFFDIGDLRTDHLIGDGLTGVFDPADGERAFKPRLGEHVLGVKLGVGGANCGMAGKHHEDEGGATHHYQCELNRDEVRDSTDDEFANGKREEGNERVGGENRCS